MQGNITARMGVGLRGDLCQRALTGRSSPTAGEEPQTGLIHPPGLSFPEACSTSSECIQCLDINPLRTEKHIVQAINSLAQHTWQRTTLTLPRGVNQATHHSFAPHKHPLHTMPSLLKIPNELLSEIAVHLDALATSNLQITCRSLSSRLAPAMLQHAISPKHGVQALHWAAQRGHLALLKRILPMFPVDLPDACGDTALYYACRGAVGDQATVEAIVRLLVAHGADVNGGSGFSAGGSVQSTACTPLMVALRTGFAGVARMLLDAGGDPNCVSRNGDPLLVIPAQHGDREWLERLLDHGAAINGPGGSATNPLMAAVEYGHLDIVRVLLDRGAELRYVDSYGDTPVLQAVFYGRVEVAEYLVALPGADITSCNSFGDSPLLMAAGLGLHTVVMALLDRGCPLDGVNLISRSALEIARTKGWDVVERIILEEIAWRMLDGGADNTVLSAA